MTLAHPGPSAYKHGMRKLSLVLAALLAGAALSAQPAPTTYVVTADFSYASKYVFRGLPLGRASFQPSIKLTAGNSYASVWLNQPFAASSDPEFDFYAGHNFQLPRGWSLDAGAILYYYPQADTTAGVAAHTFEGYLGLNGAIGGTNLGAYLFRDVDLDSTTAQATAAYSLPLNAWATLSLSGALGCVVPDHGARYAYCSLGTAVPCKLSDAATLTFGANWATHDQAGAGKNNLWFTAGLTVTF